MKRIGFAALSALLFAAGLIAGPASSAASAPTVDGLTIRWSGDGWWQVQDRNNGYSTVCEGRINSCVVPSASSYKVVNHSTDEDWTVEVTQPAARPPTPSIIQVEKTPNYVSVMWRRNPAIRGVNVYRDDVFLGSVGSPNNVFNDFDGREGATYELIAYGYNTDRFSNSAVATARNDELDPVDRLRFITTGANEIVLTWIRVNSNTSGWWVYRNGAAWRYVRASSGTGQIIDTDASSGFTYEVQAARPGHYSLRNGILGPAVDEYLTVTPTGRARVEPWPGANKPVITDLPTRDATTARLAEAAITSSEEAAKEHEDFEAARFNLGVAVGALGLPQTGGVTNPRNWLGVGMAGLETKAQNMEAIAANEKAFDDLKAYNDCMATNCGYRPPTDTGEGGEGGEEVENIPGTNTPGGCNEGGCWPA